MEVHFLDYLYMNIFNGFMCRYLRRTQPQSRTMAYGWGTKVEQVITTCTKSTVIPHWMVPLSICTLRWLLVIGSVLTASKLSKQLLSLLSYAREKAQSNSMTLRLSSRWSLGRWGPQPGNSRPPTKHPGRTCLCNFAGGRCHPLWCYFFCLGVSVSLCDHDHMYENCYARFWPA